MTDTDFSDLIVTLQHGYPQTDLIWQVLTLLLSVVLALILARAVRGRAEILDHDTAALGLGKGGVRRLAFALIAMGLLAISKVVLQHAVHVRVDVLRFAIALLFAWALIRSLMFVLRMTFSASSWLGNFERWFAVSVWVVVVLHLTGLLPGVIDWLDATGFRAGRQQITLWMMMQGLATVLVTLIGALWVSGVIEARLMHTPGLDPNLRLVFSRLAKSLLVLVAVLIALPLVGINLTTLSIFGGALGVGLGLGLQRVAASYVSGFILLLDRSIRIGNMIAVGPDRGIVTQITTRYSVLQNLNGTEVIVPNELMLGSVVQNETYSNPQIRLGVTLQVDYKTDIDQAIAILEDAARAHPRVLADPAPTGFLASFGDSGINLELGFWIADPQEGSLNVRSDIQRDVLRRFRSRGIEIPYPQREVRLVGGVVNQNKSS